MGGGLGNNPGKELPLAAHTDSRGTRQRRHAQANTTTHATETIGSWQPDEILFISFHKRDRVLVAALRGEPIIR